MIRKLWLLFAQACTLCVAALFVVITLRPDLVPRLAAKDTNVVLVREASAPAADAASMPDPALAPRPAASYADAAKKAMTPKLASGIVTSPDAPGNGPTALAPAARVAVH